MLGNESERCGEEGGSMGRVVCPKCDGRLMVEFLYQFGHAHTVKSDGTLSKRYKKTPDGSEDVEIVYCKQCRRNLDDSEYMLFGDRLELIQ